MGQHDEAAWHISVACAHSSRTLATTRARAAFAITLDTLRPVDWDDREAVVAWEPSIGWIPRVPRDDPRFPVLDLYLPICSATDAHPLTIGHLGQSLDGFIATTNGDSQFVTGHENILHLHRMRALSDAIVVGAGTIAADDPQLTTRHVHGPSPVRVVLDPARRLHDQFKVFKDAAVETLYVCARSLVEPGEERFGLATLVAADDTPGGIDITAVVERLRARGCSRIFVEGGGVTVSWFLEANLLDRLQVAVAPLIIGDGRPAIRLPGRDALHECLRPTSRVFRMGSDIFFDCDLRA
ncbi:MAG: RibD family protein, partial [Acidobacteriaceae bacterium]|nr:RibD family protein [Acidobacteriaceae bacterium]